MIGNSFMVSYCPPHCDLPLGKCFSVFCLASDWPIPHNPLGKYSVISRILFMQNTCFMQIVSAYIRPYMYFKICFRQLCFLVYKESFSDIYLLRNILVVLCQISRGMPKALPIYWHKMHISQWYSPPLVTWVLLTKATDLEKQNKNF